MKKEYDLLDKIIFILIVMLISTIVSGLVVWASNQSLSPLHQSLTDLAEAEGWEVVCVEWNATNNLQTVEKIELKPALSCREEGSKLICGTLSSAIITFENECAEYALRRRV